MFQTQKMVHLRGCGSPLRMPVPFYQFLLQPKTDSCQPKLLNLNQTENSLESSFNFGRDIEVQEAIINYYTINTIFPVFIFLPEFFRLNTDSQLHFTKRDNS